MFEKIFWKGIRYAYVRPRVYITWQNTYESINLREKSDK